jgi:Phosphotransferase enzyme family
MAGSPTGLLESVTGYVVRRGLLPAHPPPVATELVGGVSGVVVLVRGENTSIVVKTALAQLQVAGTWLAKPERALTEAAALDVLHPLSPQHTPQLLDVDPALLTFSMTAAPASWRSWKELLMSGACTDEQIRGTAGSLGAILGSWHRRTWHDEELAARFDDYEALEQLRVAPFHRVIAQRHPRLGDAILSCAGELLSARDCLVHGDYSPKNVLVGDGLVGDGLWVLDFEVAHFGAAVFDLAFMQCHLMLKAVHLPARASVLAQAGGLMVEAYRSAMHDDHPMPSLAAHTACLLLARVDGLSPAGYLSPAAASRIRTVASHILSTTSPSLAGLWELITEPAAQLDVNRTIKP